MAQNYRDGPQWLPGTVAERRGPLTYLVLTGQDLLWKRHINQQLCASECPGHVTPSSSISPLPHFNTVSSPHTGNEPSQAPPSSDLKPSHLPTLEPDKGVASNLKGNNPGLINTSLP